MLHSVSAALRKPNLAKIHQRISWSLVCPWNPLNPKPHKFSSRPPSDDFFIQCCFFHAETLRNLPCMKKWSDGGLAENVGGGSAAPQGPYDETCLIFTGLGLARHQKARTSTIPGCLWTSVHQKATARIGIQI